MLCTHGGAAEAEHAGRAPLWTVLPAESTNATVEEKHVVPMWWGWLVVYCSVMLKLPVNPLSVTAAAGAMADSHFGTLNEPTNKFSPAADVPAMGPLACNSWTEPPVLSESLQLVVPVGQTKTARLPEALALAPATSVSFTAGR